MKHSQLFVPIFLSLFMVTTISCGNGEESGTKKPADASDVKTDVKTEVETPKTDTSSADAKAKEETPATKTEEAPKTNGTQPGVISIDQIRDILSKLPVSSGGAGASPELTKLIEKFVSDYTKILLGGGTPGAPANPAGGVNTPPTLLSSNPVAYSMALTNCLLKATGNPTAIMQCIQVAPAQQ